MPFTGILKDCNETIAVIPKVSSGHYQANARLIAAAPELLSVLNEAIPFLFKLSGALDIFHKAVAVRDRAMGETP